MTNPKEYNASNKFQKQQVLSIIEEFADNLANIKGKCMDIGCGPGNVTKDLLLAIDSNAEIIGTDISESMIKYANATLSDNKRLRFDVLNIQTKNLPQNYVSEFDHIFSFFTLHWCNDIRQAFENIYQMLQPNGTMLLNMIASHDIFEILKILTQDIRFAPYIPEIMKNISPFQESKNARKELKELLQNIGFTVYHCSLREMSYFETKSERSDKFLKSIMSILTFHKDMPSDLKEKFENVFTHEYMRRKINCKSIYNNQEFTLDLQKGLIVYAQKIV